MDFQELYCQQGTHDWNYNTLICSYCGIKFGDTDRLGKCDCGSDSVKHPGHAYYCKKFKKEL